MTKNHDEVQPSPSQQGVSVHIEDDRLVKRQAAAHSRLERERTQFGARVGAETGLFEVPEILSYDDRKGEIVFEYVTGAVPLREYLSGRSDPRIMEHLGEALAALHNFESPPGEGDVFWHGDCGMRNALYSPERDSITLIDWANADWTLEPQDRSFGNPGMDLGVALISLFHQRPLGYMYVGKTEALGSAFLEAYQRERGSFSLNTALPFMTDLLRRRRRHWISQRGFLRNLAHDPSLLRLRIFLHRMKTRLD